MRKHMGIAGLVLLITLIIVFGIGCQKKNPVSENSNEANKETELLFAFDSYQEIVGTRVQLGNQFGATQINTDKAYLTEGKGSWLLRPQGNYENASVLPYFTFDCDETTFKNSDFATYDKLMLDIYNDSEEASAIRWTFIMKDDLDGVSETQTKEYVLSPKSWTTCEYEITDEEYGTYFHSNEVVRMTVTFLDRKESKDDVENLFYVDNLRGHLAESRRELTGMEYNLSEGLTFEKSTDQYVFSTNTLDINKLNLSRVAYKDSMLDDYDASFGEYCLQGDATGSVWPAFTLKFDRAYEKDMLFSFWVYIQVDEDEVGEATWFPDSFISEADRTQFNLITKRSKFNRWVKVYSCLPASTSTTWTYFNLDKNNTQKSWFDEDVTITIYMDNFKIEKYQEDISVNEEGTVSVVNPYNKDIFYHTVKEPAKKGDIFKFDIDFNMKDVVSVWLLGDGGTDGWETEWYAKRYETWSGKQTITVRVPQDTEYFTIVFSYGGKSGQYEAYVATISNIQVGRDTVKESNDGTITLQNNFSGYNETYYISHKPVKAGQKIRFDLDVTSARSISVWLLGCEYSIDTWENEWFAKQYDEWTGKTTITVEAKADIETFTIFVKCNDEAKDFKKTIVTISNLDIGKDTVKKANDGTITLQNDFSGDNTTYYISKQPVKAGQLIRFELDVTPAQSISVWLLGCEYSIDTWENEWFAKQYDEWTGKTTITVEAKADIETFTIYVKYNDEDQDFKKTVVTVSNLNIGKDTVKKANDGTITLQNNFSGENTTYYVSKQPVKAGQSICFELDVTPAQSISVWLLGCEYSIDTWENEWFAKKYDEWTGKTAITVEAKADIETFTIYVKYNDEDQDFKKTVVTISNLAVLRDIKDVSEDGTITIQNAVSGSNQPCYVSNTSIKKGSRVSFDVEVTPAQDISVWFLGCDYSSGAWYNEWYAARYANGVVSNTITLTTGAKIDVFTILVQYNDATQDHKSSVVTIKNLTIEQDTTTVSEDGTITIQNTVSGSNQPCYVSNTSIKKGSRVSFDVEVTPAQDISVWFLGCDYSSGAWYNEWYAARYADGVVSDTITLTTGAKIDVFTILVQYNDATQDHKSSVVTIKNLTIEQDTTTVSEDGTITIQNTVSGSDHNYYVCNKSLKAGDIITFEISGTPIQNTSVWFFGCDNSTDTWANEWYAKNYPTGVNETPITVTAQADVDVFTIQAQCLDSTLDRKQNVVTITNLKINGVAVN